MSGIRDFRPISLLPLLSKVLEKIVSLLWIRPYLKDQLSSSQFAYIPGPAKGTSCALTLLTHRILKHLDTSSGAVRVLSIDYAKAFDSLPHTAIMNSLVKLKLPKESLNWIHSFLTGRRQSVKIGSDISSGSTWVDVPSGVPQGSVLGPLLFCAVIDDLSVIHLNTDIIKYADDVTILHYVRSPSDDFLEDEWSNITSWSSLVGLPINMAKCSIMDVVTKRSLSLKAIRDVPQTNSVKILGVTFCHDFTWNTHVDAIVRKASKRMFVLRNLRRSGCPADCMLQTYVSLIRSVILYCYPAICNMPMYLFKKMAGVEKRASRVIGHPMKETITQSADLVCKRLFEKIHDTAGHPLRELFLRRDPTQRNPCGLRPPLTKTKRFKNTFIRYCKI